MELRFTVITVVLNGEAVIRKTIESVLNQTLPPYEYLIQDGCSTDNTVAIAEEYKRAFEARGVCFRVISEKDTGLYNAMNKAINYVCGNIISFLNAGDWYEADAIENIDTFYRERPFDLAYGGLHYINPNGTVINKMSRLDYFLISSRNWNHPSMFLKTEIYRRYGFNECYRAYADFDLYLKLRRDCTKVRVIDKVITNFVADGISTNTSLKSVLARSKEKYAAYRSNGYGRIYWFESYGWELFKMVFLRIRS